VPKARVPGSQPGSRATSPNPGSRATSPLANGAQKRKAEDPGTPASQNGGPSAGGQPKLKKKKVAATASNAELEGLIIDWLRNTENPTTRGCIQHFNSYLVDAAKKKEFSEMVKRVAALKDGRLTLKPEFRSRNP
jgi:transcription initiation factor TFIIF subunit alpha